MNLGNCVFYCRESQKAYENLLNNHYDLFEKQLLSELNESDGNIIEFPFKMDSLKEFTCKQLTQKLKIDRGLDEFAMDVNVKFDDIAKVKEKVILINSKSNYGELTSELLMSKNYDKELISSNFNKVKSYLNVDEEILNKSLSEEDPWLDDYFNYVNQIVYLYYLNKLNEIDAYLVNLYFYNDENIFNSPSSVNEWKNKINEIEENLGFTYNHSYTDRILNLFFDYKKLV